MLANCWASLTTLTRCVVRLAARTVLIAVTGNSYAFSRSSNPRAAAAVR